MSRLESDYAKYDTRTIRRVSSAFPGTVSFDVSNTGNRHVSLLGTASTAPVTRYVLVYREKNPYSTGFFKRLQFLQNRFGASGPIDFAWEIIPFSFVIDWFVDTAGLIGPLEAALGQSPVETISLTKSRKVSTKMEAQWVCTDSIDNSVVMSRTLGSVTNSTYERSPLGRGFYLSPANRYGKKQVGLSLALLRQRLR